MEVLTFPEIAERMDQRGIPKLLPASKDGFAEPAELFFCAREWKWLGRIDIRVTQWSQTRRRNVQTVETWILEQTKDARWIKLRIATAQDNERIDSAKALWTSLNTRCSRMEAIR